MKYAILKVINGNFSIDSEWNDNLQGAIVKFHDVCKTLWNAADVETATVQIIDNQGDVVQKYKEFIYHEPVQAAPEPVIPTEEEAF